MRNPILKKVAASVATFLFCTPLLAQTAKPFASKVQTPSTKEELVSKEPAPKKVEAVEEAPSRSSAAPAARQLHLHSFGLGLGQTFLLGNYADHGDNKIAMDLLYAYAASYSFDLLINAHWSEHQSDKEKLRVMGLNGSIKSRLFEFDNFSPYVLGGLGFYAPKAKRFEAGRLQKTDDKITFGANFGGGVDLRLNDDWTVGALGQLHWPFSMKQSNQSALKGYYFKLLLTLAYSF
ncbi:MAG: outer membrane protein [Bacteriovoracia bacterium]